MVTVTHEMSFARRFADRILYMDDGRFVEIATPEEMFTAPQDERTRQFLSHLHVHGSKTHHHTPEEIEHG